LTFGSVGPKLAVGFAAGSVYMLALFALELVLGLIQVRGFAVNSRASPAACSRSALALSGKKPSSVAWR
jgi:hypothetical protein